MSHTFHAVVSLLFHFFGKIAASLCKQQDKILLMSFIKLIWNEIM